MGTVTEPKYLQDLPNETKIKSKKKTDPSKTRREETTLTRLRIVHTKQNNLTF